MTVVQAIIGTLFNYTVNTFNLMSSHTPANISQSSVHVICFVTVRVANVMCRILWGLPHKQPSELGTQLRTNEYYPCTS